MGICICYESKESKSKEVLEAINKDLIETVDQQPWLLCEPPKVILGSENRLTGWSKINLMPDPEEAAEAEEFETDKNDLEVLVLMLSSWSKEYEITWQLRLEDEPIGEIISGVCDDRINNTIRSLSELPNGL